MGIVRSEERQRAEIEELRCMLLACAAVHRRKDDDGLGAPPRAAARDDGERTVCVTSGVSFLGRAVVDRLLLRGYSVRILVDTEGTPICTRRNTDVLSSKFVSMMLLCRR